MDYISSGFPNLLQLPGPSFSTPTQTLVSRLHTYWWWCVCFEVSLATIRCLRDSNTRNVPTTPQDRELFTSDWHVCILRYCCARENWRKFFFRHSFLIKKRCAAVFMEVSFIYAREREVQKQNNHYTSSGSLEVILREDEHVFSVEIFTRVSFLQFLGENSWSTGFTK